MLNILKLILTLSVFSFLLVPVPVKAQINYHIVFYNVENLYDTFNDPNTNDDIFTPGGQNHWTKKRFDTKVKMIYKAIMAATQGQFPDLIGLAEVENKWIIEQLISSTPFTKIPYDIIHKESPDPRGIDVALLYRKDRIKPIDCEFITVSDTGKHSFVSRDILHFISELKGNKVHFFINHWPSRSGGYIETKEKRNMAAKILRCSIDTLLKYEPYARILIMGDFNATPKEQCILDILKTFPYPGTKEKNSLINLSDIWLENHEGTISRSGQWEIFDQFICSGNLLDTVIIGLIHEKTNICRLPFLLEPDPIFLGAKPYRTYLGPVYHGGISDHLPIVTILKANK